LRHSTRTQFNGIVGEIFSRFKKKVIFFQEVGRMQANETINYADGTFELVVEQCIGCDRIIEIESSKYCRTYVHPAAKWRLGMCNFATHAKPEIKMVKVRVNPLKASKRASRRKK